MLEFSDILLTILFLLLFKYLFSCLRKPPNFPPGPPHLPVLGSLPFLPGTGTERFVSEYVSSFGAVTGTGVILLQAPRA